MAQIICKFCGGAPRESATFTVHSGIVEVARNGEYLDGPGVQERLAEVCDGHVYMVGLTPAIQHPDTGIWVAGISQRVGGTDEEGRPFYTWILVPIGMSPAQAAELQLPDCFVGELSTEPVRLDDLFPHGRKDILGTGVHQYLRREKR